MVLGAQHYVLGSKETNIQTAAKSASIRGSMILDSASTINLRVEKKTISNNSVKHKNYLYSTLQKDDGNDSK